MQEFSLHLMNPNGQVESVGQVSCESEQVIKSDVHNIWSLKRQTYNAA